MPGPCIILPHDIFKSLSLGVMGYHFHLFFFSFLGLSKLNSTEQWCLSPFELSCRTVFAFETSSASTPTSPNRTTTGFWVCTCTFCCCFDLFQLKGKMKTGVIYFKCWTRPLNGWVQTLALPFLPHAALTHKECICEMEMMRFPFSCPFTLSLD